MNFYIFIHIDKNGGTSIERALNLPEKNHRTALDIKSTLPESLWKKAFKFSIVRNPWDRVVSQYFYRIRTDQLEYYANGLPVDEPDRTPVPITFSEWVTQAYVLKNPRYHNNLRFFLPQVFWLGNTHGEIIVDYVGRFENIEQDFDEICRIIGVKASLPHLNKTERKHYRECYTAETKYIIGKYYHRDLEAFGYTY